MTIDNQDNRELVLYTLIGCHLCDGVAVMLQEMGLQWTAMEIDLDPELEKKYDIHIPVLGLPDTGEELFFPFDEDQVRQFLKGKS